MFTLHGGRLAVACRRREFLRRSAGLTIASFAAGSAASLVAAPPSGNPLVPKATDDRLARATRPTATSCILVYLLGGPSHLDMFDLKPRAPAEIRGPFRPIATNVPGIDICEHLPRLAKSAHRYALVRSVSHPNSNHTPMIYYTLTGRETAQPAVDNDVRPPQRSDFPHMGAILARQLPTEGSLPGFVALPELAVRSSIAGEFKRARAPLRGGGGGFLGPEFDPFLINGAPGTPDATPDIALPKDVSAERLEERASLLSLLERGGSSTGGVEKYRALRERAFLLAGSSRGGDSSRPFALDAESDATRDRYGRHRFGQSMLLARRLCEAGARMVAIHFNDMTQCDGWDTHSKNFEGLKEELLPMLDEGLAALLDDLERRGRLDETLVACMGEFGRTPKINSNAGRDHWGHCSTALLAGGGVRGGKVVGASDRQAAFPTTMPVDPIDIQATIYHALGLSPHDVVYDEFDRPHPICTGRPLVSLL